MHNDLHLFKLTYISFKRAGLKYIYKFDIQMHSLASVRGRIIHGQYTCECAPLYESEMSLSNI
jgi:hypothetical protein